MEVGWRKAAARHPAPGSTDAFETLTAFASLFCFLPSLCLPLFVLSTTLFPTDFVVVDLRETTSGPNPLCVLGNLVPGCLASNIASISS